MPLVFAEDRVRWQGVREGLSQAMTAPHSQPLATQAMLDAFAKAYKQGVPFREDRVLEEDLRTEVAPVLEALTQAVAHDVPLEQAHEAYALVTLLTRRAGLLGATPTAAHALSAALVAGVTAGGHIVSETLRSRLTIVAFEGYCTGRDERVSAELTAELARSQIVLEIAPRCLVAFLSGPQNGELLAGLLEELARNALRGDAASCLLDVSRLALDHDEIARALFGCIATLRSLGVTLVVCGRGDGFEQQRTRFAEVSTGTIFVTSFDEGFKLALAAAGHELKARRRWPKDLFARVRAPNQRLP